MHSQSYNGSSKAYSCEPQSSNVYANKEKIYTFIKWSLKPYTSIVLCMVIGKTKNKMVYYIGDYNTILALSTVVSNSGSNGLYNCVRIALWWFIYCILYKHIMASRSVCGRSFRCRCYVMATTSYCVEKHLASCYAALCLKYICSLKLTLSCQ